VLIPFVAGILWLGIAPAPPLERIEAQSQIAVQALEEARQGPVAAITQEVASVPSVPASGGER
jgi:hypothetical protein